MIDAFYTYLDRFFYEVNFTAFATCAIVFSIMLTFWLVLFVMQSAGYMSKFIDGVRRTNRFLDKHLIITDYNADEFFEKSIKRMPSPYVKGWKSFYTKRDLTSKDGSAVSHFALASQKRTIDYANSAVVIGYRLVSFVGVIAALATCHYSGLSLTSCMFLLVFFATLYIILSSGLRLRQYLTELKFNRKNDEFIYILESFTKFKSQITPLSHKLIDEKDKKSTQTEIKSATALSPLSGQASAVK